VSTSQSIVLLLTRTQIIAKLRAPLSLWMFDAGLGPHSITLICCGFVVQLTDATTTVEMYSRTGLLQRLQQVVKEIHKKSGQLSYSPHTV